jgi:hypothetical protein
MNEQTPLRNWPLLSVQTTPKFHLIFVGKVAKRERPNDGQCDLRSDLRLYGQPPRAHFA